MAARPEQGFHFHTGRPLDRLVTAPRRLTGEPVEPGDLLAYEPPPESPTAEDAAWLGADLSRLGEVEPYEWGPTGPPAGLPPRREPGVGLVVQGTKRSGP